MARKHDDTYKLIFSQRAAVEDLVRNFVGDDLAEELDFGTLEALPTDRISGGLVRRQVDLLWKIRFRGSWLYLLILLEFQSESDYFMALRVLTYICLTYEELLRRKKLKAGDKLPPVLPVTVYNGQEQVHRDGVQQGLERGLEQGLERGRTEGRRALVERLATRKFGAATAEHLSRVLEDIADPETFAEVADAIMECDSDAELIARVGA